MALDDIARARLARDRAAAKLAQTPIAMSTVDALAEGMQLPPPEPEPYVGRQRVPGVYFVACAGHIKIGVSGDIEKRFRDLQNMSGAPMRLLGAIPGDERTERGLHERFDAERRHGEWFRATNRLRQAIAAILVDRGYNIVWVDG